MEGVDRLAARGGEAEMQARPAVRGNRPLRGVYPQHRGFGAVAERRRRVAEALVPQGLQRGVIEALARRDTSDPYGNVVDHWLLSGFRCNAWREHKGADEQPLGKNCYPSPHA